MLNIIWCIIILFSIICAGATGNMENLTNSILSASNEAVELIITMTGTLCLWSGIAEIAEKSGLSKLISKLLSPFLSKLFPDLDKDGKAFSSICANVTANLLGLGNAATPLGIRAMKEIEKENRLTQKGCIADRDTVMFVILNTTSVQIMPTMIISVLSSCGSTDPAAIIPDIWGASIFGLIIATLSVSLFYSSQTENKNYKKGK